MSDTTRKLTYSVAETAELFDVDPESVRRWIRRGDLKASRVGRSYRISRPDLRDYYRERGGGSLFDDSGKISPIARLKADRKAEGEEWEPTREQIRSLAAYTALRTFEAFASQPHVDWESTSPKTGDWEVFFEVLGDQVDIDDEWATVFRNAYEEVARTLVGETSSK